MSRSLYVVVLLVLFSACTASPSEGDIQTAIASTQASEARLQAGVEMTLTALAPVATSTPITYGSLAEAQLAKAELDASGGVWSISEDVDTSLLAGACTSLGVLPGECIGSYWLAEAGSEFENLTILIIREEDRPAASILFTTIVSTISEDTSGVWVDSPGILETQTSVIMLRYEQTGYTLASAENEYVLWFTLGMQSTQAQDATLGPAFLETIAQLQYDRLANLGG